MPGRIAPLAMAWRRRMGGTAGPLSASGEASNGDPVQIEMYINGSWVDITAYVMVRDDSGNISVDRGRRDEGSQTDQSTCELQLNNRDGRWSPRNPTGTYYGLIGRNQTLRVSVPNGLGGKSYRFWGEVSVWPQGWDPTGTDVWTDLQASGILRRLAQGPESAHSLIYNALTDPVADSLVAYWPMEDVSGSATIATALTNGSPMTYAGTPTLAGYEGFPASDPVPLTDATSFNGGVVKYSSPTQTQVRFLCFIPSDGLTDGKVICAIDQLDTGGTLFWELMYTTTGNTLWLRQFDGDGSLLGIELVHTLDVRGKKMYISVELAESGANITRAIRILDLNSMISHDVTDTQASATLDRVTKIQFGPASRSVVGPTGTIGLSECAIGHATVENTITANTILGLHLNPIGEAAGRRIERLCGEEGIAFGSIGDLDDTVAMGNQGKLNPLNLMQEAETADGGMLYENMQVLGLGYRTRNALSNQDAQLTLDYAGFNLSEVPTPVEDDRYIQNRVIVTVNGISETYALTEGALSTQQPPAGVGVYGEDITLNLESADEALSHAAWRVHLGTVDEPRYPQISVNLAHSSFTANPALKQAVLGLRQGDRILVQNPPSWLPPGDIDQIILGFNETITHFEHRITFVCAPASPYTVGILDSSDARIDTDGSELQSAVSSSATEIAVIPSTGQTGLWTADPADTPFDIRVGGEIMTGTTVGQVLNSNPFFQSDISSWSAQNSTIARSTSSVHPDAVASMLITPDGVSSFGGATCTATSAASITPAAQYEASLWVYSTAGIDEVQPLVDWFDSVGGFISSGTTPGGFVIPASLWTNITATYTAPGGADNAILAVRHEGTPAASDAYYVWAVRLVPVSSYSASPQTFTVSRSTNGIVKSQSAGEDIRLAYPTTIAL